MFSKKITVLIRFNSVIIQHKCAHLVCYISNQKYIKMHINLWSNFIINKKEFEADKKGRGGFLISQITKG